MSDGPEGKPITINVKTWQFIATICTIILASIALATPWTQYQAKNALAPKIDAIEVQLGRNVEKSIAFDERLSVTTTESVKRENMTKERLDRIENKIDRLLERSK